jgi:AraC-like DNA-binding protein
MIGRLFFLTPRRNPLNRLTTRLDIMPGRPAEAHVAADALSDVLKTIRLTGATFFDVAASAPWVAEQLPAGRVLPTILPGAGHLIAYHVVTEGRCFANIIGEEPILVEAGEVIVFTRGDPHVMASHPHMRADAVEDPLNALATTQLPFTINHGRSGPVTTRLVCGFLACDAQLFNPLLDNLPPVIKVGEGRDGPWLSQFIRVAATESAEKQAGGESVLARLSELMFIEVVRRHLTGLPENQDGWLAGLRDPFVGRALSLMHANPACNWTIEDLARDVGLSRSVLAERFAQLVGVPPMQYLAQWRMQIASGMLSGGRVNIATVAAEIGYSSEAAFSRAYKRMVGVPPSVRRRSNRGT